MSKDRHQILSMLAEGKINVDEAERLLAAIGNPEETTSPEKPSSAKGKPRYLRVVVNSEGEDGCCGDQVNIKIPMNLLRAGIKLKSLLPEQANEQIDKALHEKGVKFDFNDIKPESLDELIEALCELTVDVNSGKDKVRICCE